MAFGVLGDAFGAKRVLVAGLFNQALATMAYYFIGSLSEFYAVAALFGFTYAGVMPLYSVLARENFPLRHDGDDHRRSRHGGQSRYGNPARYSAVGFSIRPAATDGYT